MRRLALTVLVAAAITTATAPVAPGAGAADAGSGRRLVAEGEALRSVRTELLDRIARLADEAVEAHATAVLARQREVAATVAAGAARRDLVASAVAAFVHGGALGEQDAARARIFAVARSEAEQEVVAAVEREVGVAATARAAAERADARARAATSELEAARAALEATIEVHEARTAAALAEEARNALARRLAEEERARALASSTGRATAGGVATLPGTPTGEAGGEAPTGGYTDGQQRRIARATAAQADLLASHPFGPVAGMPAGVVGTGTVVEGPASWYGPGFDGRPTASGALYDQEGWTVASRDLPLGTVLLVTRGDRAVLVLVNDRGPYVAGRVLDLSHAVARHLQTVGPGVAPVRAEVVELR